MANPIFLTNLQAAGGGAATPLSASRLSVHTGTIQAKSTNTASVFIGDSTVAPGNGIELTPGSTMPISVAIEPNGVNLAQIFFASSSSAARVIVFAWEA